METGGQDGGGSAQRGSRRTSSCTAHGHEANPTGTATCLREADLTGTAICLCEANPTGTATRPRSCS